MADTNEERRWLSEEGEYPTNIYFPSLSADSIVSPPPTSYWLQSDDNYPTHGLLPSV